MRKIFCILSVLSLSLSQGLAAEPFYKRGAPLQMSRDPKFRERPSLSFKGAEGLEPVQACPVTTTGILDKFSQRSFSEILGNVTCLRGDQIISSKDLDANYCETIRSCSNQIARDQIVNAEKGFLDEEANDFLIRENTQREIAKYRIPKSNDVTDLLTFIQTMPEKYRKEISKCDQSSTVTEFSNACLGESVQAQRIQSYIRTALNKSAKYKAELITSDDSTMTVRKFSKNLTLADESEDFSKFYASLQKKDLSDIAFVRENSNDLDPEKDTVLNGLIVDIFNGDNTNNVAKIPEGKLRSLIIESLVKSGNSGNDYIFKYPNAKSREIIEAMVDDLKFVPSDFNIQTPAAKAALSDKINKIRVSLANSHLAADCQSANTSIERVCSVITQRIQSGQSLDLVHDAKSDPLDKMISYYKKHRNPIDQSRNDKTISALEAMKNAPDKLYQKYLAYYFQKKACNDKFRRQQKIVTDKKDDDEVSPEAEEKLAELKSATRASRQEAIAALSETVKRNDSFQKEAKSLGFKFNDTPKNDLVIDSAIHTAKAETPSSSVKSEDFINSAKNLFSDPAAAAAKNTRAFEPAINNENAGNFNVAEDHRKDRDNYDYEQKMRSKLADLELKEKMMSKKVSSALGEGKDAEKPAESDELADLRKQIEDLKKAQTKTTPKPGEVASDNVIETAKLASSASSKSKAASIFGSKNNAAESDDHNDSAGNAATAIASNAAHSSDYGGAANANAASRGPAAVDRAGTTSGSKAFAEKSGIILTKSGDVLQDPATILENPVEGEIVNLLEATKGLPFLIRENGVLMKVSMELDSSGKPQLNNGKPRFKKVRLSKAQEASIAKEANIQKSMKEVDRDPTRLFNLKSLIKEVVKRE